MSKMSNAGKIQKVIQAINKISSVDGKDIVEEVRSTQMSDSPVLSQNRSDALYEASYRGLLRGEIENAKAAESQMTKEELDKKEDEIINRFLRDLIKNALSTIPEE